jgi:hypothetical protein
MALTEEALPRLAALAAGLLFVSEADHPLRVVHLGVLAESDLPSAVQAAASRVGAELARVELETFFARATEVQPYHTAAERSMAERFRALVAFLADELAGARVYRVGAIDVDAYAIGRSLDGEWLGVATKIIET